MEELDSETTNTEPAPSEEADSVSAKTYRFNPQWLKTFDWLVYDQTKKSINIASRQGKGHLGRHPTLQVKKKWSDMKLGTKKRVAAVKRAKQLTGGGRVDPSLELTAFEERVAGLIGSPSISGIRGGGDTDSPQTSQGSGKKAFAII
ncbi:unnamed protein product [Boreogadus saida]